MAEFTGGNEKYISVREPIIFENETESKCEVCAGIVFHKSGIYEVSIVGNKTIVSEVPKLKMGKWIESDNGFWTCSECRFPSEAHAANIIYKYCPNCGTKMGG